MVNYRMSRVFVAMACGAIAFGFTGCKGKSDAPAEAKAMITSTSSNSSTNRPVANLNEAPVLSEEDSAFVQAATGKMSEADKAWRDLQRSLQPPAFPPEWQTNEPTKEQVTEFQKKNAMLAAEAADRAHQFYTKYATNEHAAEAQKREYDLLKVAVELGNTNAVARLEALETNRLKDPNLPEDERIGLRVQQIQRIMGEATEATLSNSLVRAETAVRSLQRDCPARNDLAALTMSLADLWFDQGNFNKSGALAQEVLKGKAEDDTKEAATALVKKVSHFGKPISIKFTALDGREVNMEKLRGKVVLVDFWATWCGPCMRELPNVKAAYEKLHDKGFEIVGISYDDNKEALQRTVTTEEMKWPQFFDADNAGKSFADEYGVTTIPSMWLVDKKGVVRDLMGRTDLAGKVEKLLAEK
jgi:thiol-disulfide isomerase/thioredoxin